MPSPLLTLPFSKKEQNQWRKVTEICQTLLMASVACGQGQIQGVGLGACILPPAIFKNVFYVYNFSMISKLFDST